MVRITFTMVGVVFLGWSAAHAAQCPPGYRLDCKPQTEQQKQKAPAPCRCVAEPAGSWSGGGKSDIKKKNVPQVQKQRSPGPKD